MSGVNWLLGSCLTLTQIILNLVKYEFRARHQPDLGRDLEVESHLEWGEFLLLL